MPTSADKVRQRPWVMRQTWEDLLFAHWRVGARQLRSLIPRPLTLDLFDGHAWVGVVPFLMSDVALRGMPAVPWLSSFAELNVRTYVTVQGRPGVYFFSLDAERLLAVVAARTLLRLPYFAARMRVRRAEMIRYDSRRRHGEAEFVAQYSPVGDPYEAQPGTLDYFLTERYCLYTVGAGGVARLDIRHRPWSLQAASAEVERNTMLEAAGISGVQGAPLLHFARRQQMVGWLPVAVPTASVSPFSPRA